MATLTVISAMIRISICNNMDNINIVNYVLKYSSRLQKELCERDVLE